MTNQDVYDECVLRVQSTLAANSHISPPPQVYGFLLLDTAKLNRIQIIEGNAREYIDFSV